MTDGLTHAVYRGLPDDAIWARVREQRDEAALRVFLDRHGGRLVACAAAVTGDEHTAHDALQEAMIRLLRDRGRLPHHRAAIAWLYTAVHRAASAVRRAERRRRAREERVRAGRPEAVPAAAPGADDIRQVVGRAVAELPPRERQAVELVYFEGLTHADAANALGWKRGAVGSYLSRALTRLEGLLSRRGVTASAAAAVLAEPAAARPPAPSPELLAVLAAPDPVAVPLKWVAAVLAVGLGVGATILAGEEVPHAPAPPTAPPAPKPATEPVPERTRRLFDTDVNPRLLAALTPLALGGGGVTLDRVDTFDCKVDVSFSLRHRVATGTDWTSRIRFQYCTASGAALVAFDLHGDGKYRDINLAKPIVLMKHPFGGLDLTMQVQPLTDALTAFARFPRDAAAQAAAEADRAAVADALRRFVGVWYERGVPAAVCRVSVEGQGVVLEPPGKAGPGSLVHLRLVRGRLEAFPGKVYDPMTLTSAVFHPDGGRIEFPEAGRYWTRTPAASD